MDQEFTFVAYRQRDLGFVTIKSGVRGISQEQANTLAHEEALQMYEYDDICTAAINARAPSHELREALQKFFLECGIDKQLVGQMAKRHERLIASSGRSSPIANP
jgi:hypothetical protein